MAESGPGNYHRSKHIAVRFFFAKGLIERGVILVEHLWTYEMLADTFTKPLSHVSFYKIRGQMHVDVGAYNNEGLLNDNNGGLIPQSVHVNPLAKEDPHAIMREKRV